MTRVLVLLRPGNDPLGSVLGRPRRPLGERGGWADRGHSDAEGASRRGGGAAVPRARLDLGRASSPAGADTGEDEEWRARAPWSSAPTKPTAPATSNT